MHALRPLWLECLSKEHLGLADQVDLLLLVLDLLLLLDLLLVLLPSLLLLLLLHLLLLLLHLLLLLLHLFLRVFRGDIWRIFCVGYNRNNI